MGLEFSKEDIVKFLNIALQVQPGKGGKGPAKDIKTLPKAFGELRVSASIGCGRGAFISWVAFTGYGQIVKNGIYPVFLYYCNHKKLIVAYGVSATNKPSESWEIQGLKSIDDYFKTRKITLKKTEKKYNTSFLHSVYDVPVVSGIVDESKFDVETVFKSISEVCDMFKYQFENTDGKVEDVKPIGIKKDQIQFDLQSLIAIIKKTELLYEDKLIQRYACSLMTKPFVILSGLAGSGKTQLALTFAKTLVEDEKKQLCVVSVGADWTNREPLLGYPNALKENSYVKPENGVLDLLIECNKKGNESKPYFLILDEMNLSYVERYFADFLSAMESHEKIPLWKVEDDNVPMNISLPKNLFIVGTINVDETTYMFSPKVLDRASVIEFKVSEDDMNTFLESAPTVNIRKVAGSASKMSADFVRIASNTVDISTEANGVLKKFFAQLKTVNAEFGYRTATEIGRFITLSKDVLGLENAIDAAIVQKLLPKLHGSRKKIVPVLNELWKICGAENGLDTQESSSVPQGIKYPLTADKVLRMYNCAIDNGFTSFAEA